MATTLSTPGATESASISWRRPPLSDVGLEAGFPDPLNDVFDLFRSGAVRHVHNHGKNPFEVPRAKQKPRSAIAALGAEV